MIHWADELYNYPKNTLWCSRIYVPKPVTGSRQELFLSCQVNVYKMCLHMLAVSVCLVCPGSESSMKCWQHFQAPQGISLGETSVWVVCSEDRNKLKPFSSNFLLFNLATILGFLQLPAQTKASAGLFLSVAVRCKTPKAVSLLCQGNYKVVARGQWHQGMCKCLLGWPGCMLGGYSGTSVGPASHCQRHFHPFLCILEQA